MRSKVTARQTKKFTASATGLVVPSVSPRRAVIRRVHSAVSILVDSKSHVVKR